MIRPVVLAPGNHSSTFGHRLLLKYILAFPLPSRCTWRNIRSAGRNLTRGHAAAAGDGKWRASVEDLGCTESHI
eukprot:5648041-Pleurochrysis_carterae.AAC.3